MESWIRTRSGGRFDPFNPRADDVVVEDVAHALANLCRFSGHTRQFYSVAQHCVLASMAVTEPDTRLKLGALCHDASEAYVVDIPSPIKKQSALQLYRDLEKQVMNEVWWALMGTHTLSPEDPRIKQIDLRLCAAEAKQLMKGWREFPSFSDWEQAGGPLPIKIEPWSPKRSQGEFLRRYYMLRRRLEKESV